MRKCLKLDSDHIVHSSHLWDATSFKYIKDLMSWEHVIEGITYPNPWSCRPPHRLWNSRPTKPHPFSGHVLTPPTTTTHRMLDQHPLQVLHCMSWCQEPSYISELKQEQIRILAVMRPRNKYYSILHLSILNTY